MNRMVHSENAFSAMDIGGMSDVGGLGNLQDGGLSEEDSCSGGEESNYDSNLITSQLGDDVTAHLAMAGTAGLAAAAAIASARRRRRLHNFETNPSVRRRQATRLLRKLKQNIDEFSARVGQQAVILICNPVSTKVANTFRVFGASPLDGVVKNFKNDILMGLQTSLKQQAPPPTSEGQHLFELPPLVVEGIPTPVDKMTQAQLRAFIPIMLRYSTNRGKPGWGREATRPVWWPRDVPWANVRSDVRFEDEKARVSWTNALRDVVRSCYRFHSREDLLIEYEDSNSQSHLLNSNNNQVGATALVNTGYHQIVHTIKEEGGVYSYYQVDPGDHLELSDANSGDPTVQSVLALASMHSDAGNRPDIFMTSHPHNNQGMSHSALQSLPGHPSDGSSGQEASHMVLDVGSGNTALVSGMVSIPMDAAAAMVRFHGQLLPVGTSVHLISGLQPVTLGTRQGITLNTSQEVQVLVGGGGSVTSSNPHAESDSPAPISSSS